MIWACFHPEMDLKATKMAFMANHPSRFFSKVVFMLVLRYIYYPISFVSQIHFVMLGDICSYLCYMTTIDPELLAGIFFLN